MSLPSQVPESILNRKGPRRQSDVTDEVLDYLNRGLIESKNLSEWLIVDQKVLLKNILSDLNPSWISFFDDLLATVAKPSQLTNMKVIGKGFYDIAKESESIPSTEKWLCQHTSDIVRSWGGFLIGSKPDSITNLLKQIQPLAADQNSGCREIAFMAVKPSIDRWLDESIKALIPLTQSEDPNLRRFAVESTRPIGVWTNKIQQLKDDPAPGRPLLEPLKSDPSKYVQNSVANWLNDASKSRPDWVKAICVKWQGDSNSKETAYIIKQALRTINKNKS